MYGKESLEGHPWDDLIADPVTSIERLVSLMHKNPENANIRIPNIRERWIEVVREETGQKQWVKMDKNELLDDIVETSASHLEGELDPLSRQGQRWEAWHERLASSREKQGDMYKQQKESVHQTIARLTR